MRNQKRTSRKRLTIGAAVALVAGTIIAPAAAQSASAEGHWPPVTRGCGGQAVELYWHSTGEVHLYAWKSNNVGFEGLPTDLRGSYTETGDHSYNFGTGTHTFGFGESSGSVDSWGVRCVDYF